MGNNRDITERWLESYQLPEGAKRVQIWDARLPGFGVIIGPARRSFVVRAYRRGGKGARALRTLGHWASGRARSSSEAIRAGTMTVAAARSAAIVAIGEVREAPAPTAAPTRTTLAQAAAVHVDRMRARDSSPRSVQTLESEVSKHLAAWLDRPLREITRTETRELHETVTESCGPYVANRTMRHLRAIWNSAKREHDMGGVDCPVVAVNWNKERRRQEPVPWTSLPAWRKAVDAISPVRRDYQLLVLLTGLRAMDAATIRWEHFDPEARTLHRPVPKGGADRAFTIPLSMACAEILVRRRGENHDDHGWAFPAEAAKDRPCHLCAALGLPPHRAGQRTHLCDAREDDGAIVSPHRLRDTYTTACAEVGGLSGYAIDVLTNHRPPRGSVTAGYISLSSDHLAECQERVSEFLLAKMTAPTAPRRLRSVA